MKKLNKSGFTLVELLSVIVILSVVVLIATNAVIPAATSARKQVLASEANDFVLPASTKYVNDKLTTNKCYSYQEIIDSGLIQNFDPNHKGSILIEVGENGKLSYKVWLSNGTYMVDGKTPSIESDDVIASAEDASTTCGVN